MPWYDPRTWADESQSSTQKRNDLNETGLASNQFAEYGQGGFMGMTGEAAQSRDYLRRLASGQESVSQEQLRQGLSQQQAAQRSFAASAAPQNAQMAALTGAQNMMRNQSAMSGQAALAGLQERQQAQQALAQMIMQQRQQDLQAALGARGNAINAYGNVTPDKNFIEKWGNAAASGAALATK